MAIPVDDLRAQAESGPSITPGTQNAAALRVLATNPETAFTPSEIADRVGFPPANAPTVCRRLAEMGAASTENGHYYLPQDDATAAAVRRALGSAHQRELAQRTAEADEPGLGAGSGTGEQRTLSEEEEEEEEVAAEIAEIDADVAEQSDAKPRLRRE